MMPVLQEKPLFHETEYAIDCMLDELWIDAASAFVVRAYGDRKTVNDLIDDTPKGDGPFKWRHRISDSVLRYADSIIADMVEGERAVFASMGIASMWGSVHSIGLFCANWAIGDMVEGGYGEPYNNRPPRCRRGTALPFKKTERRLHSPAWIRRYVKRETECLRLRRVGDAVRRRAVGIDQRLLTRDTSDIIGALAAESAERRRVYETAELDRMRDRLELGATAQEAIDFKITIKPKARRMARARMRQSRKVMWRGFLTAETIVGTEKASAFARGGSVILEGQRVDLSVARRGSCAAEGMHAIDLTALDKDTGKPVADLCFYIENTPAIDQLTAVALHVAAGAEDEIIEAANLVRVLPDAVEHPVIEAKRAKELAAMLRFADWRQTEVPCFRDMAKERDALYWEQTKPLWLESVGVFTMGAQGYKLMRKIVDAGRP